MTQSLDQLLSMGFGTAAAQAALVASGGDVELALLALLDGGAAEAEASGGGAAPRRQRGGDAEPV